MILVIGVGDSAQNFFQNILSYLKKIIEYSRNLQQKIKATAQNIQRNETKTDLHCNFSSVCKILRGCPSIYHFKPLNQNLLLKSVNLATLK